MTKTKSISPAKGVRHQAKITVTLKKEMYQRAKAEADSKAIPFASFVRMALAEYLQNPVSDTGKANSVAQGV